MKIKELINAIEQGFTVECIHNSRTHYGYELSFDTYEGILYEYYIVENKVEYAVEDYGQDCRNIGHFVNEAIQIRNLIQAFIDVTKGQAL